MLNGFWIVMVLVALVCAALGGKMEEVSKASVESAGGAVDLAIGLVGVMAFFLGAMTVLHRSGLLRWIARRLEPVMRWLFPGVPADHPAMSMMILNMTSNMLGLGNAATPFGLKAMIELDKLNDHKGTATNAMALFLAINTSHLAILPSGIISLRASLGSAAPGAIIATTLLATMTSTLVAIVVAKTLCGRRIFAVEPEDGEEAAPQPQPAAAPDTQEAEELIKTAVPTVTGWRLTAAIAALVVVVFALGYGFFEMVFGTPAGWGELIKSSLGTDSVDAGGWKEAVKTVSSFWLLPVLIVSITFAGLFKGVKVYDSIVEGGKEGFRIALRIIPYLVTILVAVGMLRASGALDLMVASLEPITRLVGMPAAVLPMAVLRPLSGTGAFAIAAETMTAHGPDSLVGMIVSTMQGSTETTFYVLALYFGVVGIRRIRHTLLACLSADVAGALAAVWFVRLLI